MPPTAAASQTRVAFKDRLRTGAHAAVDPVVRGLLRLGARADHLTIAGLVLSLAAGLAFAIGRFRLGAAFAAASGVCDILDGQLARRDGHVSRFGAFLDSTLDRVAEAAILVGIAWFYIATLVDLTTNPSRVLQDLNRGLEPITWGAIALLALLALLGSFMVSYTRARAEGLGLECKVGWFERPERLVLLIVAGLFGLGPVVPAALLLLTVLSFVTAAQRVTHVWKITRGAGHDT
ncbi:MAG TPA: CDP-alcohol phosphatidyltransferase family protein [Candidatus Eisenbacteria bacterium]|nr:CDP-alcohol phosphatidyltransferase family protein [Candidatus Eisenbacteria bacterium]